MRRRNRDGSIEYAVRGKCRVGRIGLARSPGKRLCTHWIERRRETTTLQILMNLVHGFSGGASVLGVNSKALGPREYARIGYVSEGQEMPDGMTIAAFLTYWRPFYPTWDQARERELLELFRLPLDRKLKHLSRGMRMKAALVSSLAYRPELIVLDEPISGLDPLVRDELSEGLLACAEESTILISSHDLG